MDMDYKPYLYPISLTAMFCLRNKFYRKIINIERFSYPISIELFLPISKFALFKLVKPFILLIFIFFSNRQCTCVRDAILLVITLYYILFCGLLLHNKLRKMKI